MAYETYRGLSPLQVRKFERTKSVLLSIRKLEQEIGIEPMYFTL